MSDEPNSTDDETPDRLQYGEDGVPLDDDEGADEDQEMEDLVAEDFDVQDVRTETIVAAQTEGLELVYSNAKAILKDPKSSALAKVAAMKVVMEIGKQKGRDREKNVVKPEDETLEQFEQRYAAARVHAALMEKEAAARKLDVAKFLKKQKRGSSSASLFD